MPSIEKCKEILTRGGSTYSAEQIEEIRNLLYSIAQIDYNSFIEKEKRDDKDNDPLVQRFDTT